jgi:hypothetical protein
LKETIMAKVQWFDNLHRSLTAEAPRRRFLSSAGALVAGLGLGGPKATAGKDKKRRQANGKNQRGKKTNKKKKNQGSPPSPTQPPPPSPPPPPDVLPDICDTTWPDQANRDYCGFIREQCPPGGERQFCIQFNRTNEDRYATCCPPSAVCCGVECCGLDVGNNGQHCSDGHCCPIGEEWCPGVKRCVDTYWDLDHCGGCLTPNPNRLQCCSGSLCPPGKPCVNGECTCGGYNYCLHRDLGWVCFSGDCSLVA